MNHLGGILRNFLSWFGDPDPAQRAVTEQDLRREFAGATRFASLLPHEQYDPELQLFSLAGPGSGQQGDGIGFCLEAIPQTGADDSMVSLLGNMINALPERSCLQVSLYADSDISGILNGHLNRRSCFSQPALDELARRRRNHYGGESIFDNSNGYCLRDFRLFVSVSLHGSLSDPASVERARDLRDSMRETMRSASLPSLSVDASGLVNLIASVLSPPDSDRIPLRYDPLSHVRDQAVRRGSSYRVLPDRVEVRNEDAIDLVTLAVDTYPAEVHLSGMSGICGDFFQTALSYRSPFLATMCLRVPDRERMRATAELRAARAVQNASSAMAKLLPTRYEQARQDWELVTEALANGGDLVDMCHYVVLPAKPEGSTTAISAAQAVWRARGFELTRCIFMQVQGLLATLPLALTPAFADDLRAAGWMRRMTTFNAAQTVPVLAEWKGSGTPTLLLFGRRGQAMPIDLFDISSGNHNAVVAGASGAGKSVLLNEIAAAHLAAGARVWIIDIGRSYENACKHFGGEFVEVVAGGGLSLNPFSSVRDIDSDMELLQPLFSLMMAPQSQLSGYELARLQEAIKGAWNRCGREATPSDVRDILLEQAGEDLRRADMAAMLYPYTKDGVYGSLFTGPATVSFGAELTVLELEELKSKKDLQSVVLFILMYQITQAMYHDRTRRKIVLVDEAWDLMSSPASADFIEHGYRRARKYGGAFVAAAQSISDFRSGAGRAAAENSDWTFLLRQKTDFIDRMVADGEINLTPSERQMLMSLRTSQGHYSEILIKSEIGSGIGRLILDPFSLLLYSSKAEDFAAVQSRRDQGMSVSEAIDAVLADRNHA